MQNYEQILGLALSNADALNMLSGLMQKINLLTDELAGINLEEIDLNSDTASHFLQTAKIKADTVRHFVLPALELTEKVSSNANKLFEDLKAME